jgi:hypothetical protein
MAARCQLSALRFNVSKMRKINYFCLYVVGSRVCFFGNVIYKGSCLLFQINFSLKSEHL